MEARGRFEVHDNICGKRRKVENDVTCQLVAELKTTVTNCDDIDSVLTKAVQLGMSKGAKLLQDYTWMERFAC